MISKHNIEMHIKEITKEVIYVEIKMHLEGSQLNLVVDLQDEVDLLLELYQSKIMMKISLNFRNFLIFHLFQVFYN